jgi:hypothetical protein
MQVRGKKKYVAATLAEGGIAFPSSAFTGMA